MFWEGGGRRGILSTDYRGFSLPIIGGLNGIAQLKWWVFAALVEEEEQQL